MRWQANVPGWLRAVLVVVLIAVAGVLVERSTHAGGSAAAVAGPGFGSSSAGSGSGTGSGGAARPVVRHVVVMVAGAVRHPGVYKVRSPGRLIDAVKRAGGLTADADLTQVNLAAHLTDARQIVVPRLAGAGAGGAADPAAAGAAAPGGLPPGTKLSLNSATEAQLETLDGVGPSMAQKIVAERTKLGGFTSLDQLDQVEGVGALRLASLKQQLEL